MSDGNVWFEYFQTSCGSLLRFPALADFIFDPAALEAGITAKPALGLDESSVAQIYLHHVLPMLLADDGELMVHGAAVDVGGYAAIFLGASGRGKSTLATSFASSGFPFLSDDSIRLEKSDGKYFAHPGHPTVRLWRDSDEALFGGRGPERIQVSYTSKSRYAASAEIVYAPQPLVVQAVYVLSNEGADGVVINSLAANHAMMEFFEHVFILDTRSPTILGQHFQRLATFANHVDTFMLDYPRSYERLPEVRAAIVRHVRSLP